MTHVGYLPARVGAWLFALTLLVSALLKAAAPGPAAHALLWTGLKFGHRVLVVDLWSLFEAAVAGALMCTTRRLVHLGGAAVGGLLILIHALGAENCGCFGTVSVPNAVTLALLVVGVVSCAALARKSAARTAANPWALAGPALAVALMVVPLVSRPTQNGSPENQLAAAVGATGGDALFIIGSYDCRHCLTELNRIDKARNESAELQAIRCVLVVREVDRRLPDAETGFDWLKLAVIPDELWWQLVLKAPPTFVRVADGQVGSPSPTWR